MLELNINLVFKNLNSKHFRYQSLTRDIIPKRHIFSFLQAKSALLLFCHARASLDPKIFTDKFTHWQTDKLADCKLTA